MADNTKIATIKLRRATTEAWAATEYVPEDGEPCVEITTDGGRKLKIGDGKTAWGELPYVAYDDLADLTDDANHRTVTDAEKKKWNEKQDALTFDSTPTASSKNPVTSGGVKTELDKKANDADLAAIAKSGKLADAAGDATHRTVTDAEKTKWNTGAERAIPAKTSDLTNDGDGTSPFATENKVKEMTSTVYKYKGSVATFDALPTEHEVGDTYNVVAAHGSDPAGTNFAWNGEVWDALGGSIDVSVFVKSSELAAIAKSGKLADAIADATHRTVTDAEKTKWDGKQNALTFDSAPTANSKNPVTSGGVKTELDKKANDADLAAIAKSGKLADAAGDATHRTVTDAEKTKWDGKQNALTFDSTPTANSTNPVTSGGVKKALDEKANTSAVPTKSTQLTDSADLMRYTDSLTIDGGGV